MAILLDQIIPEGIGRGMLDEVSTETAVEKDAPVGLVAHLHFIRDGQLTETKISPRVSRAFPQIHPLEIRRECDWIAKADGTR